MNKIAAKIQISLQTILILCGMVIISPLPVAGSNVDKIYDVKNFGARGDGKTFDTVAIQAAIDKASNSGGGKVILPAGVYLSGSLQLKSHVEFNLETNATLLGSISRSDYIKERRYALLLADGQEDVTVSGDGTINGQGRALALDILHRMNTGEISHQKFQTSPDEGERPSIIMFQNCRKVKVTGITIRDASSWTEIYDNCEDLLVDGIHVNSAVYWNADGIDIVDCQRVQVIHSDFRSEDDGICLKSEKGGSGCYDVNIDDCRICSLVANAFKLGTHSYTGFRKIHANNLTVYDTRRSAIALECVDGGLLEDVLVENVTATNTGNAIFLRLGHRDIDGPVGQLQDVEIRNVKAEVAPMIAHDDARELNLPPLKSAPNESDAMRAPSAKESLKNFSPSSIVGLPGNSVKNVRLENIDILYPGGSVPGRHSISLDDLEAVPELPVKYPEFWMFGELPACGFYVRHAEGIHFENVHLAQASADYRPTLVFDDVRQVFLDGVTVAPRRNGPDLVFQNVRGAIINQTDQSIFSRQNVILNKGCNDIEGLE